MLPPTRGISRSGSAGSYSYAAIGNGNRPIAYVSWFDAARFVNWLNHGQPTGPVECHHHRDRRLQFNGATTGTGFTRSLAAGPALCCPTRMNGHKAGYYQPATAGGPAATTGSIPPAATRNRTAVMAAPPIPTAQIIITTTVWPNGTTAVTPPSMPPIIPRKTCCSPADHSPSRRVTTAHLIKAATSLKSGKAGIFSAVDSGLPPSHCDSICRIT